MNKKLTITQLFELFAIVLLMACIASLFAEKSRFLELLSHFNNQYLYSALTLAILLAIIRNGRGFIIAIVSLLIAGNAVLPTYFKPERLTVNDTVNLKVLLANVYTSNDNHQKIIDLINAESPDIVVLQEVNDQWISSLQPVFALYPYKVTKPRNDNFGIALFSKVPVVAHQITNWGNIGIPSIEAEFEVENASFTVLATHPLPPISKETYRFRNNQISDVAYRAAEIQQAKLIVGDLNMTMWSPDYQALEKVSGLRNARNGFGVIPTWPAALTFFGIPIDHVLVSSEFSVNGINAGPNVGSDHLPLIVELSLELDNE